MGPSESKAKAKAEARGPLAGDKVEARASLQERVCAVAAKIRVTFLRGFVRKFITLLLAKTVQFAGGTVCGVCGVHFAGQSGHTAQSL